MEHQIEDYNNTATTIPIETDIQNQLDTVLSILEENKDKISDGEYLRGMNALGSLHRHKTKALLVREPRSAIEGWLTFNDIYNDDELYAEVMTLADDIVIELCGGGSSIYTNDTHNLVSRGEEDQVFDTIVNYRPEEGNAGYESSPFILHHAIQVIITRLFKDTYHELEIVRPVSCKCGWRGAHGNWDRHILNGRHQRWVDREMLF